MVTHSFDEDWSNLPEELLRLVFQRLPIYDLLRSASVCAAWSSAVREFRRQPSSLLHQAPCLLIQSEINVTEVYSLSEGRSYSVPLRHQPFHTIVGCSHGWLILADNADLYLFNPITSAEIRDLPPLNTLNSVKAVYREKNLYMATLTCNPSNGDYAIIVATKFDATLILAGAGAEVWTEIATHCKQFKDIASYNQEFYLLRIDDLLEVLDIDGNLKTSIVLLRSFPSHSKFFWFYKLWRVVPCPFGDVIVFINVSKYLIFCLRLMPKDHGGGKETARLSDLGNFSLLIGNGRGDSMCLDCEEYPGLQPNSIYFTRLSKGGFGVYDIKRGEVREHRQEQWLKQPYLFVPSL